MSIAAQATVRQLVNDFNASHPVVWHRYMNDATYHAQVELMIYTLAATMDEMRRHGVHTDVIDCVALDTVTFMLTPPADPDAVQPVTPVVTLAAAGTENTP